jgi:hypothetical protein
MITKMQFFDEINNAIDEQGVFEAQLARAELAWLQGPESDGDYE